MQQLPEDPTELVDRARSVDQRVQQPVNLTGCVGLVYCNFLQKPGVLRMGLSPRVTMPILNSTTIACSVDIRVHRRELQWSVIIIVRFELFSSLSTFRRVGAKLLGAT